MCNRININRDLTQIKWVFEPNNKRCAQKYLHEFVALVYVFGWVQFECFCVDWRLNMKSDFAEILILETFSLLLIIS